MATRPTSGLSPKAEQFVTSAFVKPSLKLFRHAAADRPPKTVLRTMVREVERVASEAGSGGVAAFFAELLVLIRSEAAARPLPPIEVPTPTNDIETAVCGIFDRLEQRLPLATILLVSELGAAHPDRMETTYTTMRLAASFSRARGERKLELLRPFAWHVLENEYGPFLHVLIQADCAAAGHAFPCKDTVGALVRDARKRGILGTHLWLDAGYVRNAAAHRDSWDYDIDQNVVRLSHGKQSSPMRKEYSSAALNEKLLRLIAEASSLRFVLNRAFERDFLATLAPGFVTFASNGEEKQVEAAFKPIEERLERSAAELKKLGWKPSP